MNIKEFILSENNKKPGCGPVELVYQFSGTIYPAVFFSFFMPWLAEKWGREYASFSGEGVDISAFQKVCYQTFLGRSFLIWGGNYAAFSSSARKTLNSMLKSYEGPHALALFFNSKDKETATVSGNRRVLIELNGNVDRELFCILASLKSINVNGNMWDRWTKKRGALSFDDAARLLQYASIAGDELQGWLTAWEDRLFPADQSLFKLSQYFFARDRAQFMSLWAVYRDFYPAEFWVAFWSEQLWQAHMVILNAKGNTPAGVATNRLPFSFLQRDWRRYEPRELTAAHAALYTIDFSLKNGKTDFYAIELFVLKFVTGGFTRA